MLINSLGGGRCQPSLLSLLTLLTVFPLSQEVLIFNFLKVPKLSSRLTLAFVYLIGRHLAH